jgi:hypothetical protein
LAANTQSQFAANDSREKRLDKDLEAQMKAALDEFKTTWR